MKLKLINYIVDLYVFLGGTFCSIVGIVNLVQLNRNEFYAQIEKYGYYKEDIYILNQYDDKWFWGILLFVSMLLALFAFFDLIFTLCQRNKS